MNSPVRLQFPKKTKTSRRKIFVDRMRKTIRPLAVSFYKKSGVEVPSSIIDEVTELIVGDIMSTVVGNPDFATKILDPQVSNREALMEKLYHDLLKAAGEEKPFAFVGKGGPDKPSEGCGKKRAGKRASA
jgi:hypothetical protein